ncbi:carbohydrate ABC transporter permease [Thermofilum pendens]|uniref:Binding-protein-dependent transport systems inner membrane component n=1 Tax=Thermofilum pendens (strain DSM 2475 / Hrk 5) TaxID=368408 RepID=A1S0G4_THEPD|nr:carbohydrate ABC transporter permease [Thermofilum pendens]ABL78944.1 binding-protein-dependent transport systems inner membrane component [Thermofilum pendens Hrk 5]
MPVRRSILLSIVGALLSAWILVPLAYTMLAAFADPEDYYRHVIPTKYTLENVNVFLELGALDAMARSVLVAFLTIAISFAVGVPAGYAVGRWVFRGKDSYRLAVLSMRMFPVMVMAIPLASLYIRLGLYDSLLGVALVHAALALPFVVLITSSIFVSIPRDLEEAGLVFGLSRVQVFTKITAPLALPGLSAAAMFTFVTSWNEVFASTILTLKERTLPALTVATTILSTGAAAPDPYRFAAATLLALPAFIVMLYMRKYLTVMWGGARVS